MSSELQMSFLKALSKAMLVATPSTIMEHVFPAISSFMNADVGVICVIGEDAAFYMKETHGKVSSKVVAPPIHICISDILVEKATKTGQGGFISNITDALWLPETAIAVTVDERVISVAYAPLKAGDHGNGVIVLGWREPVQMSSQQLAFFEVVGNILGVGIYNAQLIDNLKYRETELEKACRAAIHVQELERKRISRELHDEVGQAITAILLRLKSLQDETDLDVVYDRLNGLRYITAQTLEDVRRLSSDLRPAVFDHLGLIPAIKSYLDTFSPNSGLTVHFDTNINERLPDEVELAIYRVVQEGLTNVCRHAQATSVNISLQRHKGKIVLTLSDNGIGLKQPVSDSSGLAVIGMQERIRLLGGSFEIFSEPKQGVTITITLPINRPEAVAMDIYVPLAMLKK